MKLITDLEQPGTSVLDADDFTWTWHEEQRLFIHERGLEKATLSELLNRGPVALCLNELTMEQVTD